MQRLLNKVLPKLNPMEDKVNIAIIAGQLVVGGAERQLYLWLANLDRERFNPLVLTLHPGHGDYWEKPIETLGIPLVRVRQQNNRLIRLIAIIKILRPFKPDLIHGWHLFASPYAGVVAWFFKAKSIGSLRDSYRVFTKNRLSALLTLTCVDAILVNSYSASKKIENKKIRKNQKVFTINNAIQLSQHNCSENNNFLSEVIKSKINRLLIVSLGRLDYKKRFDLLLLTIAKLKQINTNFHLLLIGDGSERNSLEQIVIKLEIHEYVTFTGEIPDAASWLKAADIFAFTSLDEGMPNVIMEAAAAGLPIVTWRLPFYEELLEHGVSALLVEPEDTGAMKDAILTLMNSPELRESLGQAARRCMFESFSLQAYVEKMTAAYEAVLAGKMQGGGNRQ